MCPPTSIQLLSTNTTSDDNPPIMSVADNQWVPRDRVGSGHETHTNEGPDDLIPHFGVNLLRCVTGTNGFVSVVLLDLYTSSLVPGPGN